MWHNLYQKESQFQLFTPSFAEKTMQGCREYGGAAHMEKPFPVLCPVEG